MQERTLVERTSVIETNRTEHSKGVQSLLTNQKLVLPLASTPRGQVGLLSNFGNKKCGLSEFFEMGFRPGTYFLNWTRDKNTNVLYTNEGLCGSNISHEVESSKLIQVEKGASNSSATKESSIEIHKSWEQNEIMERKVVRKHTINSYRSVLRILTVEGNRGKPLWGIAVVSQHSSWPGL